ncbi:phosphotransferase [Candidatus Neomarinimicrobiota bacterium]
MNQGRPDFTADMVEQLVHDYFGLSGRATPLPGYWDQNFKLDSDGGETYVIKLSNHQETPPFLEMQNQLLGHLEQSDCAAFTPAVVKSITGQEITTISNAGREQIQLRMLTWLEGEPMSSVLPLTPASLEALGRDMGALNTAIGDLEHPAMARYLPWDLRQGSWITSQTGNISDPQLRRIKSFMLQFRGRILPRLDELPMSIIHNDANDENILLTASSDGHYRLSGLVDFGDMIYTNTVCELAILCMYPMLNSDQPLTVAEQVIKGYHQSRLLSEGEIAVLFPLIFMRLCISHTMARLAARQDPENDHAQISDAQVSRALKAWSTIDWMTAEHRFRAVCGYPKLSPPEPTKRDIQKDRQHRIGPSLSLSYEEPLLITRGRGQYLFDDTGRAYLDCVNNVCHVGHCHPVVEQALSNF